jgi:hypothetical protein
MSMVQVTIESTESREESDHITGNGWVRINPNTKNSPISHKRKYHNQATGVGKRHTRRLGRHWGLSVSLAPYESESAIQRRKLNRVRCCRNGGADAGRTRGEGGRGGRRWGCGARSSTHQAHGARPRPRPLQNSTRPSGGRTWLEPRSSPTAAHPNAHRV